MSDFKFSIEKEIAVLSDNKGYTKELNLISYNDAPAKLDIRSWSPAKDGKPKTMGKGITLSGDEAKALYDALKNIAAENNW